MILFLTADPCPRCAAACRAGGRVPGGGADEGAAGRPYVQWLLPVLLLLGLLVLAGLGCEVLKMRVAAAPRALLFLRTFRVAPRAARDALSLSGIVCVLFRGL